MNQKSIVVYYSWAGHTKQMAKIIQEKTGADMLEIQPIAPYSKNYNQCVNQAIKEIRDSFHPPIQNIDCDLSQYDIIYFGTPIWCGTMAPPMATFLYENKLSIKTICPFSTHGGGGKGHLDKDIENICTDAKIFPLYITFEGGGQHAEQEIMEWLKKSRIER